MTEFAQTLTLQSSDGCSYQIDRGAARISGLVTKSLEDDDEDNCPIILTPNVNSGTLGKIVDYMKIQKNNPPKSIKKSVTGSDFKKVVEAELVDEFVNFFAEYDEASADKMEQLYDLMFGADFMEIQPLLELTCAKLSCLGKSRSPGQIKDLLTGVGPKP